MANPIQGELVQLEEPRRRSSRDVVMAYGSKELFFAVVGHVGSGTTEVAKQLVKVLQSQEAGPAFDVEVLKAREVISRWARGRGRAVPSKGGLDHVEALQDLGDAMRKEGDHSAVARALIREVRATRAQKTGLAAEGDDPIKPDGSYRAYILDSIRHPAEVQLLSHIYQDAFILVGVVCDEDVREKRLQNEKFTDAGLDRVRQFMQRDANDKPKYGQRVSDAFHLAHYFLDNTENRKKPDGTPNVEWKLTEQLTRLKKILTHYEVVRPFVSETAMFAAQGAQLRSACLSRQVGASVVDGKGNVVALGTNEVPRAGGGVYGGNDDDDLSRHDHRCVYRPDKFCSNSREKLQIVDDVVRELEGAGVVESEHCDKVRTILRKSRIGGLLEFSRAVHAEMDALLSLARRGLQAVGTRVFVTTFPCHYCARHLVAAGVDEVQYIEPYPKSKALELHKDSIAVRSVDWEPPSRGGARVLFRPFVGVAPRLYARVFTKVRKLKREEDGMYEVAPPEWAEPVHLGQLSYIELETRLLSGASK